MTTPLSPWDVVCDMEDHVAAIEDLATALMLIAGVLEDHGSAVDRLARLLVRECKHVEKGRVMIFDALHPNKEAAR